MSFLIPWVLKMIGGLSTLGGFFQSYVAAKEIFTTNMPQGRKKKIVFLFGWFALAGICFYGANSPTLASLFPGSSPTVTSTPIYASRSPLPTPSLTATSSSQPSPTATPTWQVTPNTTPTLAADGTIPENKPLTCSTCSGGNDPIHFTIDSITVDNANGRTVWNATLNNVSGNTYDVVNNGITLQISSGTTQPVQATGYSSTYMNPGGKASIHLTFTVFAIKGVQYTFSVHLNMSDASINMTFDPVNLSF